MGAHTPSDDQDHRVQHGRLSIGSGPHEPRRLVGRHRECSRLDRLVEALRAGESRALVVHGEPGSGKTVMLDYLVRRAGGCRIARMAGMQSEMELAFAGVHRQIQLAADALSRLAEAASVSQSDWGHGIYMRCRGAARRRRGR